MANSQQVVNSINSAVSQGQISAQTGKLMLESLDDLVQQGCQGVDLDAIDSEDVTLVSVIIDASSSMSGFSQEVINAYNDMFLKPIKGAKNAQSILITTWVFSSGDPAGDCRLLHGYTPAPDCKPLSRTTYNPSGGTPLNDAVYNGETGIVAYGQTLRDSGTRTKCIVIVLSDGEENASRNTAVKVRKMSEDLLKQEIYVLSYIFFGDQAQGDKYAAAIGFPTQHRLTAGLTDSEIRRVFGTASASVISTSQAKVSANSLSANAFFTP